MTTGIRDDSIRLEFKALLEHYDGNEKLIEKVNALERQQETNKRKEDFKSEKRRASVFDIKLKLILRHGGESKNDLALTKID